MKNSKKLLLALCGLAITAAATSPMWGPEIYTAFKSRIAQKHKESAKSLDEDGHISSAIERARAAYKLDPDNLDIARQLGVLLERYDIEEAVEHYKAICKHPRATREDRLNLAGIALRSGNIPTAEQQLDSLRKLPDGQDLEFHLLAAKSLEAQGKLDKAIREIRSILSQEETALHKQARYTFVRLAIRTRNPNLMQEAKDTLAILSLDDGQDGIEAIRFYFSIRGYTASEAFDILRKTYNHPEATASDKLEAATICQEASPAKTQEIITELSKQFNLSGADPDQLYTFCRWLGRIRQWETLQSYLRPEHALLTPRLFTLRLDALANLGNWELLAQETTNHNAPINNHFRLVFRARALQKLGDSKRASEQLDILLLEIGNDRETLLHLCEYLEKTRDIPSLTHLLHGIVKKDPLLTSYAFRKLLIYERDSAPLEQICNWYDNLHDEGKNMQQFRAHKAYYDLLADKNTSESILVAKSLHSSSPHKLETRILMALAHLRSANPTAALEILEKGPPPEWEKGRIGWKILYTHILKLNAQEEKAQKLLETIATSKLSVAEREGLGNL